MKKKKEASSLSPEVQKYLSLSTWKSPFNGITCVPALTCVLIWLNWSLDASLKLFMRREFCLHCRASLHQKLDAKNHTHSSKEQKHARRLQHPMQIASKRSTEDMLATAECRNLPTSTVQTGFPLVHYSSPISRPAAVLFHPFHFPTFPAAGSCLSTPACVCVCVLWPQGSQVPLLGNQELVQVFWSNFVLLGQSCVHSVYSRG